MERYILGIDIGTTSVKVLLISESGALAAEGKADHDLISAHPGWAEENAEVWWSNAVAAVRQITDAHPDMAENIVSAGVSGMVPALVLLDHDGKPVRNTIQQNDARAVAQIEKLTALLDQDELYERTGTRTNQQHVLPRLLWVKENEPEVFARSEYVVGSYEFVTGRMTGARYIESNWAVESGLYDIRRQCWMTEQFSVLGVDKGYFPPVIASHEKALAFAQELQSPLMQLISGGALLEDDPEQSRSRSMDGICRLTKLAERAGVKLVLEADPNCTIANTNDQLRAIREIASPQLSGMIDTNALALNGENFSTAAELPGRDLCHVHFIDIDLPKNGMCLAPGDGTLPMKDYLKVLSDCGYTGGITPELWGTTYHHCAQQAMEKSLAFLRENSL